jgi:hypothetical protein
MDKYATNPFGRNFRATQRKTTLAFLITVSLAAGGTQWHQSDFIIGTFEDPCLSDNIDPSPVDSILRAKHDKDRHNYQFCKNAYFNLLSGVNHLWDNRACDIPVVHGQQKIDYALNIAAEVGLKSLVSHEPWESCNCNAAFLSFMRTENTTPFRSYKNYAAYITHHYKSLGTPSYTALQGFFVAAEPGPSQAIASCGSDGFSHGIDTLKMWIKAFKSFCPEKQSHVFIFPSGSALFDGSTDSLLYKAYIDTVFNDADASKQPQVICSNSYPLWDPRLRPIESNFFWGLATYRKKAGGRPFWNFTHSIFTYRDGDSSRNPRLHTYIPPDEATLRWHAFTNVAHGAKGIIWFTYRSLNENSGTFGNYGEAIVDCANESPLIRGSTPQRTEYTVIREINRYCACIVGPAVMASDFLNTYHKKISGPDAGGTYTVAPDQSFIPASQILSAGANDPILLDVNDANIMVGVFKDRADTATCYMLFVNKNWKLSSRPVTQLSISFKGDLGNRVFLAPRAYQYDGSTVFTPLPVTCHNRLQRSTVTLPAPLLSGEGRLIKVTGSNIAPSFFCGFRPHGEIAAASNRIDKRLVCFARGTDNRVYARIQDTADVDFWGTEWRMIDSTQIYSTIVCTTSGSYPKIFLFSTTSDGKIQYTFQSRPQDKAKPLLFNAWQTLAMQQKINSTITCSTFGTSNEYSALFFRCDSTLYYSYFDASSICHGPYPITKMDTEYNGTVGICCTRQGTDSGSIDLFVATPAKRLNWGRMTIADLLRHTVRPFTDFGSFSAGEFVVAVNLDNTLEVFFAQDDFNRLSHKKQRFPGSSEWDLYNEETRIFGGLSIGRNRDGRLEVFTRDSAGYLSHMWQLTAGKPCLSSLVRLGAGAVTVGPAPAAVASNGDGRLTVFTTCAGNSNIYFSSQARNGGGIDWQNCLPFTNISDQDR